MNIITPKELRKDAEGRERFMPSDIALDHLEDYAVYGCHYQELHGLPVGTTITRLKKGWTVQFQNHASTSKHLHRAALSTLEKFNKSTDQKAGE